MASDIAIVCLAQHSWDSAWARPQQLMTRFARERTVLFVRPISLWHVVTKSYERGRKRFRREGAQLYIYTPVVLPWGRRCAPVRFVNEVLIRLLIRRKIRRLGIKDLGLWLYAPVSEYLVGSLGEKFTVYDCTDAWAKFDDVPDYVVEREDRLSREADVVFAGTGMLYEEKKRLNSRTHLMTCGVDFGHFDGSGEEGCPEMLRKIRRPIVGYAGLIDKERLDIDLIGAIAAAHPEWSIVLVGPVQDRECLIPGKYRNVHFTGLVSYADLPGYVRQFDVAMIPYVVKEGTRYINPTKLLEYMAAGRPVVSSRIPEVVSTYEGRIVLAGSTGEFIAGIEGLLGRALTVPIDENRDYASKHSWDTMQRDMARLAGVCA